LHIDDFQKVSERTPFLADLKPSGRFSVAFPDMHLAGGSLCWCKIAAGKYLRQKEHAHGQRQDIVRPKAREGGGEGRGGRGRGKPRGQESDRCSGQEERAAEENQPRVWSFLHGNLAPEGCVGEISAATNAENTARAGARFLFANGFLRSRDSEEDGHDRRSPEAASRRGDVV
jgi:dihydroxyacid dehydratase/phosphogluconate dehydratase